MRLPLTIFPKVRSRARHVEFEQLEERAMMAVDLRPIEFSAPNSALLGSGQQVQLDWTVAVDADTPVTQDFWFDSVYLSSDETLDPGDRLLTFLTAGPPSSPETTYSLTTTLSLPLDVSTGNQFLILAVDDGDLLPGETNETNNLLLRPIDIIAPDVDLTVGASLLGGNNIVAGQPVVLDGIVTNLGTDTALAPRTQRVYFSTDDFLDPADLMIADQTITDSLLAGDSQLFSLSITLPLSTAPGTYTLFVTTDDDNQQYETNDFNNGTAITINVVTDAPDLIVTDLNAPNFWAVGQFVPFDFTVTNSGSVDANVVEDRLYLSTDDVWDPSDTLLYSAIPGVGPVAPAGFYSVFDSFTVPNVAVGSYFLLAVADPAGNVNELDKSNNVRSLAVTVDAANLTVVSATGPSILLTGDSGTIDAVITNNGTVPTAAPAWNDALYLSTDDIFDASDILLATTQQVREGGEVSFGPVNPSESYNTSFFVTLPSVPPGNYHLIVVANDGGIQGETTSTDNTFSLPLIVGGRDVSVSNVIAPPSAILGSSISITYTVTNASADPLNEFWTDRYYLSDDATLDASDVLLDSADYFADLAAGGSDTLSRTVQLAVGSAGNKFLLVVVRANNPPDSDPSNNVAAVPLETFAPDLAVTSFTAPSSVTVSSPFTLSWSVTNQGSVEAPADWLDFVYLSTDTTLDASDLVVTSAFFSGSTPLAPSELYSRTLTNTTLFGNIQNGTYYFILSVAPTGQPDLNPANNISVSGPVSVTRGDLRAVSFVAPPTGILGSSISVTYTVDNPTTFATGINWSDLIFLSDDATLTNNDTFVGSWFEPGPLAEGQSYARTRTLNLNQGSPGNKFLIFRTDNNQAISESDETNNVIAVPITLFAPDLTVSSLDVPAAGGIGQPISVSYTVTNQGSVPANTPWFDNVQLLDETSVVALLAQRSSSTFVPLAAGANYTQTFNVNLPNNIAPGNYRIRIVVNGNNFVPESDLSNNIATASIPVTLFNTDLVPTDLSAPSTLTIGEQFDLSWTVQNAGTTPTAVGWQDKVYLSDDPTLGSDDILLASELRSATPPLNGGSSYTVARSVSIPSTTTGAKFLILVTDSVGQVPETNESNNRRVLPVNVIGADLVADLIDLPVSATFGVPLSLTYTVRNTGNAATTSDWTDRFFLSDESGTFAVQVGQSETVGVTLLPNGSYTRTVALTVPLSFTSGNYRLSVRTDALGTQSESNENNNVNTSGLIPFTLPPLPDLLTTSSIVPLEGVGGTQFLFTWTTTNIGAAPAVGPWSDNLSFVSASQTFLLPPAIYTQTLAPGESVTRELVLTLPSTPETYRLSVLTDAGNQVIEGLNEGNNSYLTSSFFVSPPLLPDLVITAITPPPNGTFSGTTAPVTFTVTNIGTGPTNASYWSDYIFLTADPNIAFNDGTTVRDDDLINNLPYRPIPFPNQAYLNPGESYTTSVDVPIPVDYVGTYYMYVFPDGIGFHFPRFQLRELDRQNNLTRSDSFQVNLTPPPDLSVTSVVSPLVVFSGQSANISWTVSNIGPGTTIANEWNDQVYLSDDAILDNGDTLLSAIDNQTSFLHQGALVSGGSYITGQQISLPQGIQGSKYLIVKTDTLGDVFEGGLLANNVGTTLAPIQVFLTPPPDLVVGAVTAPDDVTASRPFTITYTVTNEGATDTPTLRSTDRVYLSTDTNFSPDDLILAELPALFDSSLAVGQSYQRIATITLPDGTDGSRFLIVVANATQSIFEVDRTNNIGSRSIAVSSRPADLVVTNVILPASLTAGQIANVQWTIQNVGLGNTVAGLWYDKLYVSLDGTANNLRLLGRFAQSGILGPGESRSSAGTFLVPTDLTGNQTFHLVTDAAIRQAEDGTSIVATGPGGLVYEGTNESNNQSTPVAGTIIGLFADLIPIASNVGPLAVGQQATVSFTIFNQGNVPTNTDVWTDDFYLSTDSVLNGNDLFLGSTLHTGILPVGQSYNTSLTFTLPTNVAPGPYFVLIGADRPRGPISVFDALISRVAEGSNKFNNVLAASTTVSIPPTPDLAVTEVLANDITILGRTLGLSWTVTNIGPARANGDWRDAVYLSVDQVFDPLNDRFLAFVDHAGGLDAGGSYVASAQIDLPAGLSGSYSLFVATDTANSIFEAGQRSNNSARDARTIGIALGDPVDLVLGNIVIPATGTVGRNATIAYTVTNQSPQIARGPWDDAIYLSQDDVLDANDALFARVRRSDDLAAGTSYTQTVSADVPLVAPGNYRVILRTDIFNRVPEPNEQNNIGASLDVATLAATPLSLGTPLADTLPAGGFRLYAVTASAGQTLKFSWDSIFGSSTTEMFVQFGRIATRSDFLFRSATPGESDPSVIVPLSQAGTYYILLRNPSANASNILGSLQAEALPFGIDSVSPASVGNKGPVTIEINGSLLTRETKFELISPVGLVIPATLTLIVNSSKAYATFDLTRAQAGSYLMRATTPSGATSLLSPAIDVSSSLLGGQLSTGVIVPPIALVNTIDNFSITYANNGDADIIAPLLLVTSPTSTPFGTDPNLLAPGFNSNILAISPDGPAGILRPGQVVTRTFRFQAPSVVGEPYRFELFFWDADRTELFNWSDLLPKIDPTVQADVDFPAIFARLQERVGPTIGDFVRMLSRNANLLPPERGDASQIEPLVRLEVEQAIADVKTSLRGRAISDDLSVDVSGRGVYARNLDTNETFVTTSRNDGSFVFASLSQGTYRLLFDGALTDPTPIVITAPGLDDVELLLTRGTKLSGLVRLPNSQPAVGAQVRLVDADGTVGYRVTGSDGSYLFEGMSPGNYSLIVDLPGYARSITPNSFQGGVDQSVDVSLLIESKITGTIVYSIAPTDPSPLRIVLTDSQNGDPNKVFSFETLGTSLVLGGLLAGQYDLRFERTGFVPTVLKQLTVGPGASVAIGNINLVRAGSIVGQLISSDPLTPADGTVVSVYQGNAIITTAVTDGAGAFRIDGLAPGVYLARVDGSAGIQSTSPVLVTEGGTVSATINILAGSTISGVVRDSISNSPISGVEVVLRRPNGTFVSTLSDDFGNYAFSGLNLGTYQVAISPGTPLTIDVTDADDAIYSANLLVTSAASIAGRVTLPNGDGVAGAGVLLIENGQVVALSITDELGHYQFLLRRAGNFTVEASSPQAIFAPTAILAVNDGDSITADLVAGTGSIGVSLLLAGVAPSSGGVRLVQDGGPNDGREFSAQQIDATGSVLFSNVTPGTYRVVGESDRLGGSLLVTLTQGENANVSINLVQQATLAGTVVGPGSVPVAGATVVLYSSGTTIPITTIGTDADGNYIATNLADGSYTVVVIEEGYAQFVSTVTVTGDTVRDITLTTSLRTLTGVVIDELGNPVAGASVLVKDSLGRAAGQVSTNGAGQFTVTSAGGNGLSISVQRIGYTAAVLADISLAAGSTVNVGNIAIESVALGATAFGPAPVFLRFAASQDFSAQTITRGDVWLNRLQERYDRTLEEFVFLLKFAPPPLPECSRCAPEKAAADAAFARANEQFTKLNQTGSRMITKVVEFETRAAADVAEIYAQILLALGFAEGIAVVTADAAVLTAIFGTGAESLQIVFNIIKYADVAKSVVTGIQGALPSILSVLTGESKEDTRSKTEQALSKTSTALKTLSFLQFALVKYKIPFQTLGDASTILSKILDNGFKKTLALADEVDQIVKEFDRDKEELERRRDDYFEKLAKYNICLQDEAQEREEKCKCKNGSGCNPPNPVPNGPPGGPGGGGSGTGGNAKDPNDILGPAGFSDSRIIPARQPLDYTIRFENISTATLPAQQVIIKATLDSDLDFRTFRVGSFGWGDFEFSVPTNQPFLSQRIDLTSQLGFIVDIVANVDTLTGEAQWILTTIDPSTGLPPADPRVGFLPPNVENDIGQGFVRYSISTDVGLPTGSIIDAKATIFFDTQAPIDTPIWSNRIDAGIPTSVVDSLPLSTISNEFLVTWSATDDTLGSGIAGVTIFVAVDDGPFQVWLSNTTATQAVYQGQVGKKYSFFSVATDNAGNVELPPATPDAMIAVLNPNPFITIVGSNQVARGFEDTFTVTIANADPWPGQGYTFFFDWDNDGTFDAATVSPTPTATVSHAFTGAGPQTFRVAYLSP
ncbi:carboxypeptidase regulatory-like domain-containing protein, partial [bacterium]|nr:carboxypeptidase regulatory-like domain-containing protein [bacterium]